MKAVIECRPSKTGKTWFARLDADESKTFLRGERPGKRSTAFVVTIAGLYSESDCPDRYLILTEDRGQIRFPRERFSEIQARLPEILADKASAERCVAELSPVQ